MSTLIIGNVENKLKLSVNEYFAEIEEPLQKVPLRFEWFIYLNKRIKTITKQQTVLGLEISLKLSLNLEIINVKIIPTHSFRPILI